MYRHVSEEHCFSNKKKNGGQWMLAAARVTCRYLVYLLYWYKSTNTDAAHLQVGWRRYRWRRVQRALG